MKRAVWLLLAICCLLPATRGQQFIGCRTEGGWAETPIVRKTFALESISEYGVFLEVTSLGYHEVYVNGVRVGDRVMQPAVSQLDRRALTVYYRIDSLLVEGDNELTLWLGQGWGRIYGTPAAVMAKMVAGSREQGADSGEQLPATGYQLPAQTDSTWEASPSGYSYTGNWQPMQFGGERYDARVQPRWRPASVYHAKGLAVSPQQFEGNRIVDRLSPVSQTVQPDGTLLLDFGRVATGWFQADFGPLPAGHEVTMEYLDHLDARPPFTETDVFIAGSGEQGVGSGSRFTNRFHTHAFRYVRLRGLDTSHLSPLTFHLLQISAVDPKSGATFSCSDPRLNAIHDMVKYTLSCLTFSGYMVDCPHIERMGYGGDGNSSTNTLQTLWDVRDTYRNWLTAWADAMDSSGDLPYVAPSFPTGGGPYWSGFIVKAPWRTYLNYGDPSLIVNHYRHMRRWLDFVEKHCEDGILQPWPDTPRRSWFLGDWAVPDGVDKGGKSVLHVSNCFLAECLADMQRMAVLTLNTEDTLRYALWRQRLVTAIHRRFYHPETHTYANGTPLDQCYALLQGIPPDSATAEAVKEQLLKDIHGRYRDHLAVGLVGIPVFTEWCIRNRQADLMATLLRQPDYPGYLQMMNFGFTTWESWDCWRPGKEDRSRVHNCYNGIGIWFYQALAGIRPDPAQPGYKHFFVDPQPVSGLDWVKCTKPTPYGDILLDITYPQPDSLPLIKVTLPPGTSATLFPGTPQQREVRGE